MNDYGLKAGVLNECRRQTLNKFKELGVAPAYIVISGSHLYGFPSKDSDIDVRCCHVRDTKDLFHLDRSRDALEWKGEVDGVLTEFVSLEIEKVIRLCMENNSNIMEHLSAKNLLTTESVECAKLREIAFKGVSKRIARPYEGMAQQNYKKFIESMNPTYEDKLVKKYLYVMRSYIVGMHALRTGKVEPDIRQHLDSLDESVAGTVRYLLEKKEQAEYQVDTIDHKRCRDAVARLRAQFILAENESNLKDEPGNREEFDDLLYNIRLRHI